MWCRYAVWLQDAGCKIQAIGERLGVDEGGPI